MKRAVLAATILTLVATVGQVQAQSAPEYINYQGILTDVDGTPLSSGTYSLELRIYSVKTGPLSGAIWGPQVFDGDVATTGHGPKVPVWEGQFNVWLGDKDTSERLILDAFAGGSERYLGIRVTTADDFSTETELAPRQRILSSPYALKSRRASALGETVDKVTVAEWANRVRFNDTILELRDATRRRYSIEPNFGNFWGFDSTDKTRFNLLASGRLKLMDAAGKLRADLQSDGELYLADESETTRASLDGTGAFVLDRDYIADWPPVRVKVNRSDDQEIVPILKLESYAETDIEPLSGASIDFWLRDPGAHTNQYNARIMAFAPPTAETVPGEKSGCLGFVTVNDGADVVAMRISPEGYVALGGGDFPNRPLCIYEARSTNTTAIDSLVVISHHSPDKQDGTGASIDFWLNDDDNIPLGASARLAAFIVDGDTPEGELSGGLKFITLDNNVHREAMTIMPQGGADVRGPLAVTADMAGGELWTHPVVIRNANLTNNADAVCIELISNTPPGPSNNFISFAYGSEPGDPPFTYCGEIQGNGAGGIDIDVKGGRLIGSGADFAEFLPKMDSDETLSPGDVVGVFGKRVSRRTDGAGRVLVISSRAIVTGNAPLEEHEQDFALVALVGQVPAKVNGPVREGDYVIASQEGNGIGIAVAPGAIAMEQYTRIVGRAIEASDAQGVTKVKVMVGVPDYLPLCEIIREKEQENVVLRDRLSSLEARLAALEKAVGGGQ